MILRIFILTCAIFISPSLGKMDLKQFVKNFEDMCFQNDETDPFRVNGQDTPLSNTLENFIAMAEKFEAANTGLDLKDELAYFISEYVFENIKFTNRRADEWKVGRASFDSIDEMWDPSLNMHNKPSYRNAFSNPEKCSLYHMISHSIVKKEDQVPRSYSPGNFSSSSNRADTPHLEPDNYFPQEIGVVAIQGTDAAVSLSKVLIGLFVGLKQNRKSELISFDNVNNLDIPPNALPQDKTVDSLYAVTLADVMMRATWTTSDRQGLAPNGKWVSIPIDEKKEISDFCPMVYKQELGSDVLPAYSYSSVRGAADGLILGLAINQLYIKKPRTKLSQILRMYYSPYGISVESSIEDINKNHVSFCNREILLQGLENKLQDQMKSYGYLIAQALKDVDKGYSDAKNLYFKEKDIIFRNYHSELQKYCEIREPLDKPENLQKETYLDVIVVMDSSNGINAFQEQQIIVGNLAKRMDLRYTGSRMTVLLDNKNTEGSGSSSKIELESVVFDTYSSSCAACSVGQIEFKASTLPKDELIVGLDQFLQEKKINDTQLLGVNGKVVVLFNYENFDSKNYNKRLEKALKDFHLRHLDIIFYTVGIESEVLRKYAGNNPTSIVLSSDGIPEQIGKTLYDKISFAPALLQLADCKDESTERTFSYDSLISPHIVQHYEMPAEYFYKSLKVSFKFESKFGKVRVCHNRATGKSEYEARNCKNATGNDLAEFKITNPCKGFSKETCSPFFFAVIGVNSNEGEMKVDNRPKEYCNDLNDKWCSRLDQMKFTVSHTGVRCSGCLGLGASSVTILLTIVVAFFIQKRF